jgi:hypothetical protein
VFNTWPLVALCYARQQVLLFYLCQVDKILIKFYHDERDCQLNRLVLQPPNLSRLITFSLFKHYGR